MNQRPRHETPRGHAPGATWWSLLSVLALGAALVACTSTRSSDEEPTTVSGVPATTTAPVQVVFSSTGDERDGLYWLDSATAVATWQLTDLPTEPSALEVGFRTVTPADAIAADGTGRVGFTYGQGDNTLGTQDVELPAAPLGPEPAVAMLSGSLVIPATDLPAQLTELWVQIAVSPSGPASLGVAPDSVTVAVAPPALNGSTVATPPISTSAPSPERLDGEFSTNGDLIAGWYWVRDAALTQYARWDFPLVPDLAGGITAQFHVLATDGYNGGPRIAARFYLAFGFLGADGEPLGDDRVQLTVPNVSPFGDPVGYTAQDTWTLPAAQIPDGAVGMWLQASRNDPGRLGEPTTEHVAFNAASIGLLIGGDGTGGDGTGTDGTDDGNADADGSLLDDPDGLADADSQADADDVGDLPPGTYHGTLDGETEDWFAFQLDGTQLVDFSIDTDTGLYVSVELYNPRSDIRAPQPQEGSPHTFSHAADRADGGRWYIRFYRTQGSGAYTFTFTVRDANDGLLHLDAGDTFETATSIGAGDLLGELRYDDPADYYTVDVPAGRTLTATVESTTATTDPTAWNASFEVEFRDDDLGLLTDDNAYPDQPASLFLEADDADRTVFIRIERYTGVGGPYRLHVGVSGAGECGGTAISAVDFRSGGDRKGVVGGLQNGWYWMLTDPAAARGQTSTWSFDRLPDDSAVRVLIDVQLDRSADPNGSDASVGEWPPLAAAAYFTYGVVTDGGAIAVGGPQFVTLTVVSRSGIGSGWAATGELAIPHAALVDADASWWIRVSLVDPTALRPPRAPTAIGVSSASLTLCAGGPVEQLEGVGGPVEQPAITVSYDAASRTMSSDESMFVEPTTDIDGDGLHQGFENQALAFANPLIALDEEELWQHWLDDAPTVNFVQATLWPSYANPQYVVLGYLNTWAYDAGGGAQWFGSGKESHHGDSERVWEAWKIIDDRTMTLEWVNTSAHASYTEHSGIWRVGESQCTKAYVAKVVNDEPGWGFFEVMCDDLEFSDDGRVIMHTAENKHAMYPSGATCESIAVAATVFGVRAYGEDCDWEQPPSPSDTLNYSLWLLGWHDDDFDDDPQYKGFGRWLFDVYNVGEPDYPLIDDLDEPASWIGLTTAQVSALTGKYPTEAVWTGHEDFSRFCGGLEMGDFLVLPWYSDPKVMPNDPNNCSTKLGGKFTAWQPMFIDAMASRYRVTLVTGTPNGAGTDDVVVIDLHDADGTLLATKQYYGNLENGATDVVYLPPNGLGNGGDVATVSIRRGGTDTGIFPDWYLQSVTVEDLATGESSTHTVGQWINSGAGIVLP